MSLRIFHVVFIILSIVLCLGTSVWSWQYASSNNSFLYQGMGVISFFLSLALIVYSFKFFKKYKALVMTSLILLNYSTLTFACSVCYGDKSSSLSKGLQSGIVVLLGVLGMVMVGIVSFIIQMQRRVKLINGQ